MGVGGGGGGGESTSLTKTTTSSLELTEVRFLAKITNEEGLMRASQKRTLHNKGDSLGSLAI